jgi:hypothetical protein
MREAVHVLSCEASKLLISDALRVRCFQSTAAAQCKHAYIRVDLWHAFRAACDLTGSPGVKVVRIRQVNLVSCVCCADALESNVCTRT